MCFSPMSMVYNTDFDAKSVVYIDIGEKHTVTSRTEEVYPMSVVVYNVAVSNVCGHVLIQTVTYIFKSGDY